MSSSQSSKEAATKSSAARLSTLFANMSFEEQTSFINHAQDGIGSRKTTKYLQSQLVDTDQLTTFVTVNSISFRPNISHHYVKIYLRSMQLCHHYWIYSFLLLHIYTVRIICCHCSTLVPLQIYSLLYEPWCFISGVTDQFLSYVLPVSRSIT